MRLVKGLLKVWIWPMAKVSAATPSLTRRNQSACLRLVDSGVRGYGMTAIWQDDGTGWRLLAPTGFPDEQTLHDLVEETPQIMPLAGDPRLVVVGKDNP